MARTDADTTWSRMRRAWQERAAKSRIYLNAYALVLNQVTSAGLGFLYWMLAARLYGVNIVGASSAVISTLLLVSGLAQMGLGGGMTRFVPRAGERARSLVVWAYVVTIAVSLLMGAVAYWLLAVFKPDTLPDARYIAPSAAVIAVIAWSVFNLQDGVLIGLRESVWVFIENTIYNASKIVLLIIGARVVTDAGIVGSWFLPTAPVIVLCAWVIFGRFLRGQRPALAPDVEPPTYREVAFSVTGDHIGSMVGESAVRALPLMVVALLGTAENAYFYQAWLVATAVTLIASGMANSYSAEAAGDRKNITGYSWGILRHIALLTLPAAFVMLVAAPLILQLFGPQYAKEGSALLRWLALSTIPTAFVVWHLAYSRVVGHIRTVVLIQSVRAVLMLALTYALLPLIGIEGAGIAWLLVNTAAAVYGLVDARGVLWPTSFDGEDRAALRDRALQRGDWRFLLPGPVPHKAAVFASGLLAESAHLFADTCAAPGTAGAAGCDVAVARQPDEAELAEMYAALAPGGAAYTEWSARGRGSAKAVRARLEAAGFTQVRLYWPLPRATTARLWLPLDVPSGRLASALKELVQRRYASAVVRTLASWCVAPVLALGPFPTLCAIGVRPCAETEDPDVETSFPWVSTCDDAGRPAVPGLRYEFAIMRAGGGRADSKANWLLYASGSSERTWVAKSSRHAGSAARLLRERRVLELREGRGESEQGLVSPRCVAWVDGETSPLVVQTALNGQPMRLAINRMSYDDLCARVTSALIATGGTPRRARRELWWDRLVEPYLKRLSAALEGLGEDALLESVRTCLAQLGDVPLLWAHNDCAPWNMVLMGDRTGVFDWEAASRRGAPAVDLVYSLAMTAFVRDRVEGTPRAIETYERLLDPSDKQGRAFLRSLAAYGAAFGIHPDDLARLRLLAWVQHAANDVEGLLEGLEPRTADALEASVTLPLLRRELVECSSCRIGGAATGAGVSAAIFVSPHLDDAALSCGAGIRRLVDRGAEVTVATVFTADLPAGAELSRLAVRSHRSWHLAEQPFAARRAEDERALALLGARVAHLGLEDAMYRRGADGAAFYPAGVLVRPAEADAASVARQLEERLGPLLRADASALVFCPLGVGGHVDHVLVRRFVEATCDASRIVYYEEYPYVTRPGEESQRDGLAGSGSHRLVFAPTALELSVRLDATGCYESQLRGLFPTTAERVAEVLSARLPVVGGLFLRAPNVAKSARRAGREIMDGIERAGGEVYWATTPDACDIFGG